MRTQHWWAVAVAMLSIIGALVSWAYFFSRAGTTSAPSEQPMQISVGAVITPARADIARVAAPATALRDEPLLQLRLTRRIAHLPRT